MTNSPPQALSEEPPGPEAKKDPGPARRTIALTHGLFAAYGAPQLPPPTRARACLHVALLCHHLTLGQLNGEGQEMVNQRGGLGAILVEALMGAMALEGTSGGASAALHAPLILDYLAASQEARDKFLASYQAVPLRVFLPWLPQLLTRVGDVEGTALMPLLTAIADTHPQRLFLPLRLSMPPAYLRGAGVEGGGGVGAKGDRCMELAGRLRGCGLLQDFVEAMDRLTPPKSR